MLSSYATITPCNFFPSFRRISSARAGKANAAVSDPIAHNATPNLVEAFIRKVCFPRLRPARLSPPEVSGVLPPQRCRKFAAPAARFPQPRRPTSNAWAPANARAIAAAPAPPPASASLCGVADSAVPTNAAYPCDCAPATPPRSPPAARLPAPPPAPRCFPSSVSSLCLSPIHLRRGSITARILVGAQHCCPPCPHACRCPSFHLLNPAASPTTPH